MVEKAQDCHAGLQGSHRGLGNRSAFGSGLEIKLQDSL